MVFSVVRNGILAFKMLMGLNDGYAFHMIKLSLGVSIHQTANIVHVDFRIRLIQLVTCRLSQFVVRMLTFFLEKVKKSFEQIEHGFLFNAFIK